MFGHTEGFVRSSVEWLRLGVETLGALVIAVGVVVVVFDLARDLVLRSHGDFAAIRLAFRAHRARHFLVFGPGYVSGGTAIVLTIVFDVRHPPAV